MAKAGMVFELICYTRIAMLFSVEKIFNKTMSKLGLHVGDVVCPRTKDHLDGPAILAV